MPRRLFTFVVLCATLSSAFAPLTTFAEAKKPPYVLTTVATADIFYVLRLNTVSGEFHYEKQSETKWIKVGEPGELSEGNYELLMFDAGKKGLTILRADRVSGKVWMLTGDKMDLMEEADGKTPEGKSFTFSLVQHLKVKESFWLYRFDAETGRAWKLTSELKWKLLADGGTDL